MSAIDAGAPESGADSVDGLRRYTTRIKAIVHSHNHNGPIILSDDVMSAQIGKNIKGVGRANLAVVARNSYLNMIYPNDYLNIYFDTGDGNGWVRTFFGLIDRIEEEYTVGDDGVPTTLYHIIATDFQKVLEKTNIYFNPHLFDRPDVEGEDFNAFNIGGVALLTRGIRVQGSPADMVLNQILLQIGFGAQWKLPDSYPVRLEDRFSKQRSEYAQGRLFNTISNLMEPQDAERLRTLLRDRGIDALQRDVEGELTTALAEHGGDDLSSGDVGTRTSAAIQAAGLDTADMEAGELTALQSATDVGSMARILSDARVRQQLFGSGLTQEAQRSAQEAINQYVSYEANAGRTRNILDIMNVFDFVERRAIDGYAFDLSIWEKQGPLVNILRSISNEAVNELLFDLRPINSTPQGGEDANVFLKAGSDWDRGPDEIGGNRADPTNWVNGVRYMPAVVMREYPFATTNRVDATGVSVSVGNDDGQSGNLGIMYFGGVFANRPNEPGRHLVATPVLNLEERVQGLRGPNRTFKHLDVAVISEQEIRQTRWGRSDQDHFNLFEMWTDSVSGSDMRYYMYDFLPIITPIHIQRHGLRTRTITTRFSRYPPDLVNNTQPQAEPPADEETEDEATEEREFRMELVAPVGPHPSLRFTNIGGQRYGYRPRVPPVSDANAFIFHNGIDIIGDGPTTPNAVQGEGNSPGPIDIVAIADGLIVGSIAQGSVNGMNNYGNTIVIYHPQFSGPSGQSVFSLYAHLAHREPFTGNVDGITNLRQSANREYIARGGDSFEPIYVRKGQKIGSMGRTYGSRARGPNNIFNTLFAHVHFEIDYRVPPTAGPSVIPRIPIPVPSAPGPIPSGSNPLNIDPVEFYSNNGVDLVAEIALLKGAPAVGSTDDEDDAIEHDDPEAPPSRVDTGSPENEVSATTSQTSQGLFRPYVDSIDQRQQLGRWALMQDHWYQHNLEYVSGSVVMRGAPEIRVGYRLDVKERRMSFYVEGIQHSWQFPNEMQTTLQVTRGQPNNPYPAYVLPPTRGFNMPREGRRAASRLAHFFIVPDPIAIRRAIVLRENSPSNSIGHERSNSNFFNIFDDRRFFNVLGYGEETRGLVLPDSIDYDSTASTLAEIAELRGLSEEEAREQLRAAGFEVTESGEIVRTDGDSFSESSPLAGSPEGATGVDGTSAISGLSRGAIDLTRI